MSDIQDPLDTLIRKIYLSTSRAVLGHFPATILNFFIISIAGSFDCHKVLYSYRPFSMSWLPKYASFGWCLVPITSFGGSNIYEVAYR